jgi:DnaJ-class molecular chaperone
MNRAQALVVLRIDDTYPDAARVKMAYRERCKATHPDAIRLRVEALTMDVLREARDYLLFDKDSACNLCKGVGKVRGRVGAQTCTVCHGTGEKL